MIQIYLLILILYTFPVLELLPSILPINHNQVKRVKLVIESSENQVSQEKFWSQLPIEIKLKILKFLKLPDLVKFSHIDQESKAIVFNELKNTFKASSYNWALFPNKVKIFQGHYNWVSQIKISNDGTFICIVGGEDSENKAVKIWDLKTGQCLHTLIGHDDCILTIDISEDSKLIVTGSNDETAKIWDTRTGKCLKTFIAHGMPVNSIAISKDNKFLFTGSDSSVAYMWDVNTGIYLKTFLRFESYCVGPIKISRDNSFLVIGSHSLEGLYLAEIWDVNTGECLYDLIGHTQAIVSIEISEDNKFIVTGSFDNRAMVWDTQTGICLHTLIGHDNHINVVKISSDSKFIVTASSDGTAKIWDMNTGDCLHTLVGHGVPLYSVAISPDNSFVVTGSMNRLSVNTAKIWDVNTGECLKTLISVNSKNKCLSIGLGSNYNIISKKYEAAEIVDLISGSRLSEISYDSALPISSLGISPDNSFVAIGSDDNTVKLWFTSKKYQF